MRFSHQRFFSFVAMTTCAAATIATAHPAIAQSTQPTPKTTTATPESRTIAWPIKTREQVDLWLHGYALITQDSAAVPFFAKGYTQALTILKNRANVYTQLDANVERLQTMLRGNRALVNAQFVPLYFSSVDAMHTTIDHFIAANGNPKGAKTREELEGFAVLANYFGTSADRAFLSLFASALWDESTKFYHSYWVQQQRERGPVIDSVQALWQQTVRPRIQRFLNNSQQRNGDIILSLPLGGEGRTISATGNTRTTIAVTFPDKPANAIEAIYVMMHEMMNPIVAGAVNDNTTPAEQRNGVAEQIAGKATVIGGLMAMTKMLPEYSDGYASFYLRAMGRTPGAHPHDELTALVQLPTAIRDAITRQLDTVQEGI